MRHSILQISLLTLVLLFAAPTFAGGDLPFPYDRELQMPVITMLSWGVNDTNLSVQAKVYQDVGDVQWLKIWIRGDDGFVWSRTLMQKTADQVEAKVTVDQKVGELQLDLNQPDHGSLRLDGEVYNLTIIQSP